MGDTCVKCGEPYEGGHIVVDVSTLVTERRVVTDSDVFCRASLIQALTQASRYEVTECSET